ncbi:hypothetical protein EV174_001014 [Coemansia sp. RSA 2320]|nr:hypothetical protein EV174_001014 [Coemansia sp. RSA 2320]
MSRGQALGDKDRWPWLQRVREEISKAVKQALDQEDSKQRYVVCACSALKGSYRELLSQSNTMDDLSEDAVFLYIDVAKEELARRLSERQQGKGHFFNPQLLDSQLETLERPDTTREAAICISGEGKSIGEVADEAYRLLVARE